MWREHLALRLCILFAALTLPAQAQLDSNINGMSDVWERMFNRDNPGQLFDPQNPAHHPDADPDGDGVDNLHESITGTDPFDPNPPQDRVAAYITYLKDQEEAPSPEYPDGRTVDIVIISWDTLPGKQYTVSFSPNLSAGSWLPADAPYYGDGLPAAISITLNDSEGYKPDKLFWRVQVENIDSDGDGLTDHEEFHLGTNPFLWDTSGNGLPDSWDILYAGQFSVWPPNLVSNLHNNAGEQRQILLSNDTDSPVSFSVALSDHFGASYHFEDSITGGATYTWEEISTTGTRLANISNHLDASQPVDLTGFTFPFHGNTFSRIHISNNGMITLGAASSAYSNQPLPSTSAPANLIAPFWDDLDTRTIGDVYFKEEANRLIIQYENVGRYQGGTNSAYTFQVVLHADGRIHYRYKSMVGVLNSATIGLHNSTRTIGLQVVHNTDYVANELAVEISPLSKFFTLSPLEGSVAANSVLALDAAFQSLQLPPGSHPATLTTTHDATSAPAAPIVTQASLHVINDPADVTLTSPASETSILQGETISLTATASDPQGMAKVEFYSGETKIGEQLAFSLNTSYYSYFWNQPFVGVHTLTARAIDAFGGVTISDPVTFTVHADANGNDIPDWWELQHFGNLDQTASGDFDGDGLSNIWEYNHQHLGFNPADPTDAVRDTSSNGLPDWWEIIHFGAVGEADASADPDSDGLTNIQEYQSGTNPHNWDTDGDLLPDGWEVQYGLNPLDATGIDGMNGDPDQDGLLNIDELIYGSSPILADTDGDGADDLLEITQGSDPADASDGGQPPSPEDIAFVKLTVGDPSGSESERYNMIVKGVEGDTRTITHQAKEFGVVSTKSYKLRKGAKYEVEIVHTGTEPGFLEQTGFSNYDWIADIQPDGLGVVLEPAVLVKKDPHTIFTEVIDWPNDTFQIKGKKAELFVMKFETSTHAQFPYNSERKKLGVAEGVDIIVTPKGAGNITWTMLEEEDSGLETEDNYELVFTAASLKCDPKIKADFGDGITHTIGFEVVEPTGESAIKLRELSLAEMGQTGITAQQQGVGMILTIRLLPGDVSFSNLETKELSGPASNESGYFLEYAGGNRYHTAEPDWQTIDALGRYYDKAAFFEWPKIMVNGNLQWTKGKYEWVIPVRWRVPGKPERDLPDRLQTHEITGVDGSSKETKFSPEHAVRTPTP